MRETKVIFRVKFPINFNVLIGHLFFVGLFLFILSDSIREGQIEGIEYFTLAVAGLLGIMWLAAAILALIGPRTLQLDSGSVTLGGKALQCSEIHEIIIHQDFMGLVNVAILPKGKRIVPVHWAFRLIDDRVASLKALEAWAASNDVDLGWGHFVRWL